MRVECEVRGRASYAIASYEEAKLFGLDCVKVRLHRRYLSWQLDAIFVALKLHQVSNMFETPAISRRQIALKIAPGLHLRF